MYNRLAERFLTFSAMPPSEAKNTTPLELQADY